MMRRCLGGALLLGLIAFAGSSAQGEMIFSTSRLRVGFNANYGWSMTSLLRNGIPFMDATSGNGTVLRLTGGGWAGSWHGNETVESVHFSVDGQEVAADDGQFYSGSQADLVRTTLLADAYRLTHTVHIEEDAIWETAQLERVDPAAQVEVFYGLLGTRSNRLTDFATYDAEGRLLSTGRTAAGDSVQYDLPTLTKAVTQYDPQSHDGVTTSWQIPAQMSQIPFIIDRPEDNKFYLAIDAGSLSSFSLSQSMRFFDGIASWLDGAQPGSSMLGDLDGNGVLDNFDLACFELALSDPMLFRQLHADVHDVAQRGDINGDGEFNNFDIASFEPLIASSHAAASFTAVPEPSGALLAAMASIAVFGARAARCRASRTSF